MTILKKSSVYKKKLNELNKIDLEFLIERFNLTDWKGEENPTFKDIHNDLYKAVFMEVWYSFTEDNDWGYSCFGDYDSIDQMFNLAISEVINISECESEKIKEVYDIEQEEVDKLGKELIKLSIEFGTDYYVTKDGYIGY